MRCTINHVQQEDRFLNRAADKSLHILIQAVEAKPKILPIVLSRLLAGHGTYNFDKITKTKTIEKLLSFVNAKNSEAVVQSLLEPTQAVKG